MEAFKLIDISRWSQLDLLYLSSSLLLLCLSSSLLLLYLSSSLLLLCLSSSLLLLYLSSSLLLLWLYLSSSLLLLYLSSSLLMSGSTVVFLTRTEWPHFRWPWPSFSDNTTAVGIVGIDMSLSHSRRHVRRSLALRSLYSKTKGTQASRNRGPLRDTTAT